MKAISCLFVVGALLLATPSLHAIMAGGETDLPADTPSARLDPAGEFSFVGFGRSGYGSYGYTTQASHL